MLPSQNPRSFLDTRVISRLAGIPLFSRRPMQGNVSGRHTSPHKGSSVEFAEYRNYVPGDDLRRIDWRAFGRSDKYFVKEFEADTNLRCCLVLDTSGSMDFGSGDVTKLEYARRLVGTIGYLAVAQADAVGLSCVADGIVKSLPPKRNPSHLRTLFDLLEQAKPDGPTHLVPTLHELAETIRQRALIILVSDLFVDPGELHDCFQHLLFRKHDLAVFHLYDPLELSFDLKRPTRFIDMEGGASIFVEPNEIADRYHRALEEYRDKIQQVVVEASVDYHEVSIEDDYEQVLTRFLVGRTRRKVVA
jgi:uncharacterized protein (DUF58 family)